MRGVLIIFQYSGWPPFFFFVFVALTCQCMKWRICTEKTEGYRRIMVQKCLKSKVKGWCKSKS